MSETYNSNPQKAYSIKLQNSLYGFSILDAYIRDRNGLKCGEVQWKKRKEREREREREREQMQGDRPLEGKKG